VALPLPRVTFSLGMLVVVCVVWAWVSSGFVERVHVKRSAGKQAEGQNANPASATAAAEWVLRAWRWLG
jgi:hypothetical protein